jgi:hypothetical protein
MVFNATFNYNSVISWRSILLVEESGENHWPVANQWLSTRRLTLVEEELQTFFRHPSHPQFSLDLCFFTFCFPILIFSHNIVWSLIICLLIAYGIFTLSQYAKSIRFIVRGRRLHFCKNCIWSHLLYNMLILTSKTVFGQVKKNLFFF